MLDALCARRVMPGVMSPLRIESRKIPAAPQLNESRLVDNARGWLILMRVESTHREAHGIQRQPTRGSQKEVAFGAAEQGAAT
jgi:hypothetical protein